MHKTELDQYHDKIVNACLTAGDSTIRKCKLGCKNKPGWNGFVTDIHQETLSWHWVWKSQNSPHLGPIAEKRKTTHA